MATGLTSSRQVAGAERLAGVTIASRSTRSTRLKALAVAARDAGASLAQSLLTHTDVIRRLKNLWQELRRSRAGRRFRRLHADHAAQQSVWTRSLTIAAAVVCFAVGIVLAFIPGPAVVFFALTAALTSTQSRWVARKLDRAELGARAAWKRWKN